MGKLVKMNETHAVVNQHDMKPHQNKSVVLFSVVERGSEGSILVCLLSFLHSVCCLSLFWLFSWSLRMHVCLCVFLLLNRVVSLPLSRCWIVRQFEAKVYATIQTLKERDWKKKPRSVDRRSQGQLTTDIHTDGQADRQTDRNIGRHKSRHTGRRASMRCNFMQCGVLGRRVVMSCCVMWCGGVF